MDSLTQRLKAKARMLGFHAAGVAPARPLERAAAALRDRTERGLPRGYGFAPGRKAKFTDPGRVLAGAKSVVAVALSYFFRATCADCEDFTPGSPGPRGRVARFAWGSDYHKALERRLASLAEWLREESGCESVACADTGPLLDRAAARQAGIGWYGKNCALIIPRYGSWVVLGELVTTAELEPDEPRDTDLCGSCGLCMKACPTGAIIEPYVIDANRCVSHLTQMKGSAPPDLREMIGDRVYGCDVCQDVCPQNRNALPTDAEEFAHSRPPGRRPALLPLLAMTGAEFEESITSNTMAWIGRTRLRRNALVAIGNAGDPETIPALVEAQRDPDPVIRAHAAWAMGKVEC
ncbi:MAG: tRNA epoxyqueuosine(34) reductase QueG [Armatimonadota bacterium]|nr:tRNA epoxyqueuosine(34) reductase QueG [Armatimonadota bacterium]